ncbi:hypothetical protein [Streptomyces sp. NPDC101150]|uniref:hypothetical protein n=1 Tax=Streptomyces sp. NPDC101150 TaxID=3366114 RepID=UPI00381C1CE9
MVRDVRSAPPADPPADPALAALRRVVDDLAVSTHAIGELMLDVASRVPVRHRCGRRLRPAVRGDLRFARQFLRVGQ